MATGGRGGKVWEHRCCGGDSHASNPPPRSPREFLKKENRIEKVGNIPNININSYNYLLRNIFFYPQYAYSRTISTNKLKRLNPLKPIVLKNFLWLSRLPRKRVALLEKKNPCGAYVHQQ
jgi:hypothetical protein